MSFLEKSWRINGIDLVHNANPNEIRQMIKEYQDNQNKE
jgi:hypothetical protein